MKWYWIITIPAVISYCLYDFLCEGVIEMEWDSAFVALLVAIIGLIGSIVGNIIVNYKGWKSSEKLIGSSKSNKSVTAMLGNDGSDRVSLSDEHKNLKDSITDLDARIDYNLKANKSDIEGLIKPNNELLIRIDERAKNAESTRRMREDLLTPSQMAIKDGIDKLIAMSDNWQKNNAELISYKEENQELRMELLEKNNVIKQKDKEIAQLNNELHEAKERLDKSVSYNNGPSIGGRGRSM